MRNQVSLNQYDKRTIKNNLEVSELKTSSTVQKDNLFKLNFKIDSIWGVLNLYKLLNHKHNTRMLSKASQWQKLAIELKTFYTIKLYF